MKKIDSNTALALDADLFTLSDTLRKARFIKDLLMNNLIPEDDLPGTSQTQLVITTTFNNRYVEIISDYLNTAANLAETLHNSFHELDAKAS